MSYDIRAHTVCEQMLAILKSSKLNYLVKETPYSAFVTIRKRFVKDNQDISGVTLAQVDNNNSDQSFKRENLILKQKCKSLEVEVGFLEIDKGNLELANEALGLENKQLCVEVEKLETVLNLANKRIHDQEEEVERKKEEFTDNELRKDFLQDQLSKTKIKIAKIETILKEKNDNLEILEKIVENKDLEIDKLRSELESHYSRQNTEATIHFCMQCNFTSESDKGLKIHMGKMHELKCLDCDGTFAGESKLKTHMCRLHVVNPASTFFYMKNWYIKNSCISIYSKEQKKEVAVLHSEPCTKSKPCSEFPPNLKNNVRVDDKDGLIHLQAFYYLKSGNISWQMLEEHIEGICLCDTTWIKNNSKANA